jgi:hypothetical protein
VPGRPFARTTVALTLALGAAVGPVLATGPAAALDDDPPLPVHRSIRFPVEGPARFRDDFGDPRDDGARTHEGNDVFAPKLARVVAMAPGTVTSVLTGASRSGNSVTVRGDDGWRYLFIHLNDDTPGTDDGAAPRELTFGPGIRVGARVEAGQLIGFVGDSGNAEDEAPQLHVEIRTPANVPINPWTSLRLADGRDPATTCTPVSDPARHPDPTASGGLWVATADGGVFALGGAPFLGSAGALALQRPIVGLAARPGETGAGYWLVASDGGVFAYGDAPFLGSMGGTPLNAPIVGMVPTATGQGYWLVASDGGVFAFGDAPFLGSLGALRLNAPIVAMTPRPGGTGYWLVASDGGVFAFGDAPFLGAWGDGAHGPIRAIAATPSGRGYHLVSSDGAVVGRGDAAPIGSLQTSGRCTWPSVAALALTATGRGGWIAGRDGTLVPLGDAPDHGDPARLGVARAVVVALVAA